VQILVRGKFWRLVENANLPKETDGECDAPHVKKKQIRIRRGIVGQRLLDAYVHELSHAALWVLGEGPVASLANATALTLWQGGVRPGQKTSKVSQDKLEHAVISTIWTRGEVAVIDEDVRREVARAIARTLTKLGWAHTRSTE
jgi:hypothetical protein